jgi:hypothetical protein
MAGRLSVTGILVGLFAALLVGALPTPLSARAAADEAPALDDAQRMFYNGRYADAVAVTATLCTSEVNALAACELRTSALLFQLRRAIGDASDKQKAFAACDACPELLSVFIAETRRVQAIARERLATHPDDHETRFVLGKLDLNYVWLQLGTLGRKTGWDEYWEARRSLDQVLKQNPQHVRAKVARAWIDYIVDTRMPRGTRWVLGGGNKKRGMRAMREAAEADADLFVRAEAVFGLWDMQVRERNMADALVSARMLADDFPDNPELRRFLDANSPSAGS